MEPTVGAPALQVGDSAPVTRGGGTGASSVSEAFGSRSREPLQNKTCGESSFPAPSTWPFPVDSGPDHYHVGLPF